MMGGFRNFWPLCLVLLCISFLCFSEAKHHTDSHKPSVVVGAVFCETCFQDDSTSEGSHYISGATVGVKCKQGESRPAFYQEVKTDEQGRFKLQLPFSISKHVKKIEGCAVKLVKSSEPYCAVASTATSSLLRLKDTRDGIHIFSAGFFIFKPLKQPGLCNQQPSVTNLNLKILGDFFQDPLPTTNPPASTTLSMPVMPSCPYFSSLPPLPPLSPGELPPSELIPPFRDRSVSLLKDKKVDNALVKPQQIFPPIIPPVLPAPQGPLPNVPFPFQPPPLVPNPFQPPASPLIPNPFQPPSPPPSLLPPLPPLPNVPNLPTVPGLTPSPPPPPPPTLPHIPFLPPIIPGIPPLNAKKVNP